MTKDKTIKELKSLTSRKTIKRDSNHQIRERLNWKRRDKSSKSRISHFTGKTSVNNLFSKSRSKNNIVKFNTFNKDYIQQHKAQSRGSRGSVKKLLNLKLDKNKKRLKFSSIILKSNNKKDMNLISDRKRKVISTHKLKQMKQKKASSNNINNLFNNVKNKMRNFHKGKSIDF